MPTYTFKDSENKPLFVEKGDYVVKVIDFELGLSKKGNEKLDLVLEVEGAGTRIYDTLTFSEASEWRIDVFLKSVKRQPKPGEAVNFSEEYCNGVLLGARGWANLIIDEYPVGSGNKKNKVLQWITNKELPPAPAHF